MILDKEEIIKQMEYGKIRVESKGKLNYNPNSVIVTLNKKMWSYVPVKIVRDICGTGLHKKSVHLIEKDKLTIVKNQNYITIKNSGSYKDDIVLDPKDKNIEKYEFEIPETGLILLPNMIYLARTNEKISSEDFMLLLDGLENLSDIGLQMNITSNISFKTGEPTSWNIQIMVLHPLMIYPNMDIGKILFFKK